MLYIFLALFVLILLLFYPLEIHTHYRRKTADDLLLIEIIIIPRLWIQRIEVPLIELEKGKIPSLKVKSEIESPSNNTMMQDKFKVNFSWENIKHVLDNIIPYYKLISCYFESGKLLFKPWNLKSFSWNTNFGTGDAAMTGIAGGMLWSTKGLVWHHMTKILVILTKPQFKVTPDFTNRKLEMEIDGIFACRIGNIIIAAIKAWLKFRACRRKE